MIKWLAAWWKRRRDKQEELRLLGLWLARRERRAEEGHRRKDYLAGYDEAAGFWAHRYGRNSSLAQAIEKSNEHRELHLIRCEWVGMPDWENDDR